MPYVFYTTGKNMKMSIVAMVTCCISVNLHLMTQYLEPSCIRKTVASLTIVKTFVRVCGDYQPLICHLGGKCSGLSDLN